MIKTILDIVVAIKEYTDLKKMDIFVYSSREFLQFTKVENPTRYVFA